MIITRMLVALSMVSQSNRPSISYHQQAPRSIHGEPNRPSIGHHRQARHTVHAKPIKQVINWSSQAGSSHSPCKANQTGHQLVITCRFLALSMASQTNRPLIGHHEQAPRTVHGEPNKQALNWSSPAGSSHCPLCSKCVILLYN